MKNRTVILGAGIAGLTCANKLDENNEEYTIYEKNKCTGGLVSTLTIDHQVGSFHFDHTGHFLHLRSEETKDWITSMVPDLQSCNRKAAVYIKDAITTNYLVPAPFQNSVRFFSEKRKKKIKEQVSNLQRNESNRQAPKNFGEDQDIKYGYTLAKLSRRYNQKIYGNDVDFADPKQMGRFATNVPYDQILNSIEGNVTAFNSYNATFLYTNNNSQHHGISILTQTLAQNINPKNIHLGTYPVSIDIDNKNIILNTDEIIDFDNIVSSIPLPELVMLMQSEGKEKELEELKMLASTLKAQPVVWFAIGVRNNSGAPMLDDNHWVYYPEKNFSFYRIGCFSNVDPKMAPPGHSSVWVELSNNTDKTIDECKIEIISYFIQSKWITSESDILFIEPQKIKTAYIVMDENYKKSLEQIHAFLAHHQIASIGRYGRWEYASMGDAIDQGIESAKNIHKNKPVVEVKNISHT